MSEDYSGMRRVEAHWVQNEIVGLENIFVNEIFMLSMPEVGLFIKRGGNEKKGVHASTLNDRVLPKPTTLRRKGAVKTGSQGSGKQFPLWASGTSKYWFYTAFPADMSITAFVYHRFIFSLPKSYRRRSHLAVATFFWSQLNCSRKYILPVFIYVPPAFAHSTHPPSQRQSCLVCA